MSPLLRQLFGIGKPIIAMVHLAALPGRPGHAREAGMRPIVDAVARDVETLQAAGVDGLLFCNEADLPYQLRVGPEAAAAMAAVIGEVRSAIRRPFGVDLVWDPIASLAVARATGACFVREVFTGVYESDLGVMQPDYGAIADYRANIGAGSVALFTNITPEFASSIGQRTPAQMAKSTVVSSLADVILVSGPMAGSEPDVRTVAEVREAVDKSVPVLLNTGAKAATIKEFFRFADGCIVGSDLKRDGYTWNEVDPERVKRFVDAARSA